MKVEESREDMLQRDNNSQIPSSDKLNQTNESLSIRRKYKELASLQKIKEQNQSLKKHYEVMKPHIGAKAAFYADRDIKSQIGKQVKKHVEDEIEVGVGYYRQFVDKLIRERSVAQQFIKHLDSKVGSIKEVKENQKKVIAQIGQRTTNGQPDKQKEEKGYHDKQEWKKQGQPNNQISKDYHQREQKRAKYILKCLSTLRQQLILWEKKGPNKQEIHEAQLSVQSVMMHMEELQKNYHFQREKLQHFIKSYQIFDEYSEQLFSKVKSSNLSEQDRSELIDKVSQIRSNMSQIKQREAEPQIKGGPVSNFHPGLQGNFEFIQSLSRASETGRSCGGKTNDGRP